MGCHASHLAGSYLVALPNLVVVLCSTQSHPLVAITSNGYAIYGMQNSPIVYRYAANWIVSAPFSSSNDDSASAFIIFRFGKGLLLRDMLSAVQHGTGVGTKTAVDAVGWDAVDFDAARFNMAIVPARKLWPSLSDVAIFFGATMPPTSPVAPVERPLRQEAYLVRHACGLMASTRSQ